MNAGRYNVLLIEDDGASIDLARRAVAESCPETDLSVLSGGDAVLEWLGTGFANMEQIPHIILLDLKLPKLDGLAVLRSLRIHADTAEIPIVVFSLEYTQDDVLMSYQVGANSFVPKPADLEQYKEFFRERLAYWMHSHEEKEVFSTGKDAAG